MASEFWLSDAQFERLRPLLPDRPRGVPRVDDRRVISGVVHVLISGGRWIDAPAVYGPRKTNIIAGFAGPRQGCGAAPLRNWPPPAGRPPN